MCASQAQKVATFSLKSAVTRVTHSCHKQHPPSMHRGGVSHRRPQHSLMHWGEASYIRPRHPPSKHRGGVSHRRPQHPPSMHRGGVSHRRPQTDCCLCEESTLHPVRTLGGGAGTPTQMHTASHRGGLKTRHFLHVRLQGCSFHDHGGPPTRTHTSDAPLRGPAGSPWGPSHQDHKLPTLPPRRRAHGELCGCVSHHKCRGKSWK